MIRFCDREVYNIEYYKLSDKSTDIRAGLLKYFSDGHQDDVVCVYDNGIFMGIITYQSLNCFSTIYETIRKEYLVWDKNLWKNAREYCKRHPGSVTEYLIPVLDKSNQLYCFAYEDLDANREIRMLRELSELSDGLQFVDIFPGYDCVRIIEFNELAYFFAKYLERLGIAVEVTGAMWQEFFVGNRCGTRDFECYTIYAEGIGERKRNWRENLLRSVSVEFECIDKIYEENLKRSFIKDAAGDFSWLAERLKDEQEIVIIGTGVASLNAYDLLAANEMNVLYFMSGDQRDWGRNLFGKKILSRREIINNTKNPVFIDCHSKNSAWRGTDEYDYEGYRRNVQYFCIKDYVEISIGNLQHALKGKKVILLGSRNLCRCVKNALIDVACERITYWDLSEEDDEKDKTAITVDDKDTAENVTGLIVEPQYHGDIKCRDEIRKKKRLYYAKLEEKGIHDITQYFSECEVLVSIGKEKYLEKYPTDRLRPKSILLNISGHMCGNKFFSNLLDGHPNILQIDWDMESIRNNLFLICIQLAEERASNILNEFQILCGSIMIHEEKTFLLHKEKFYEKFQELLGLKDSFTSQELFVIIHIAYAAAWGQKVTDLQEMLIYYEQRVASAMQRPLYEEWLCDRKVKGFSINITRNAYTRVGCLFKHFERFKRFTYLSMGGMWRQMCYGEEGRKTSCTWRRLTVKFETIKTEPEKTLADLCEKLKLPWSDSLLETTCHGEISDYTSGNEVVKNFDLKPVFNLYEEYFTDFDRFRINMVFSKDQKRFGYPYVSCNDFSERQLQEMYLKPFRFESRLTITDNYGEKDYRCDFMNKVKEYFRGVRRENVEKIYSEVEG